MRKQTIYIIGAVCAVILLLLIFLQPRGEAFDKRLVLDKNYKTPFGLYITYNQLGSFFPGGKVSVNAQAPWEWYSADSSADGQSVFFLVSQHFYPTKNELGYLYDFAKQGNQVFICSPMMNETAKTFFGIGEEGGIGFGSSGLNDSGLVHLLNPPFASDTAYFNPGYHFTAHFSGVDSLHYTVLGKDDSGYPNFIKVAAGKGCFYFNSNPMLFANYFLLYRNNISYLQKAVSLLPPEKKRIIWDEYFVYSLGMENRSDSPSPFRVLFAINAFRWAFSLAFILLALYILLGVKMVQRAIPLLAKPKNDTLEFTKTIGRLYFEKGDSTNLANKMGTYLLEHVRNKYFIKTTLLDDEFIKNLSNKAGYEEEKVRQLVEYLLFIQVGNRVTEQQLAEIYAAFSTFYKYTS